jgi:hypothetical protein
MYENKGIGGQTQGVFEYDGEPRTNFQQSNDQQNQSNHQQMMFTQQMMSEMMKHMQQEAERNANSNAMNANSNALIAQLAQKKEVRESHHEDQKMNFANQAARVAPFMRPPSAKIFFGGKTLTEATTTELRKYYETIASFVETVDQEAGSLNQLIKTISKFTYRPAVRDVENTGIESMVAVASENFKNYQACHTKDSTVKFVEYNALPDRTLKLDEQMYVFLASQFDQSSSELIQCYTDRERRNIQVLLCTRNLYCICSTPKRDHHLFTCGRLDKRAYLNSRGKFQQTFALPQCRQ